MTDDPKDLAALGAGLMDGTYLTWWLSDSEVVITHRGKIVGRYFPEPVRGPDPDLGPPEG